MSLKYLGEIPGVQSQISGYIRDRDIVPIMRGHILNGFCHGGRLVSFPDSGQKP
jgi:hypothetical protein